MFLYLETPTNHMHVAGVFLLDPTTAPGGFSFTQVRAMVASRLESRRLFSSSCRRNAPPPRPPRVDRGSELRP